MVIKKKCIIDHYKLQKQIIRYIIILYVRLLVNNVYQQNLITITQEIDNICQDIERREFERQINILKF